MIIWHFFSLIKMRWKRDENVKNGNFDEKWVLIWTNLRIAIHLSLVPLSGIENSASKCLGIYFFWHSFCPVNVTNCHNLQLLITSKFLIFEFLIFITRDADYFKILFLGMYSQSPMMFPNPFLRKPKRIRTAFTPAQLMRLEQEFKKNQ